MHKQAKLSLRITRVLFASLFPFVATLAAHAVEPGQEFLLWPNGSPGSEGKTGDEKVRIAERGERVVSNIHKPSITPYLPPADKVMGCAVIFAPGGGHRELWSDHEGHNVARWLSEHGIAAFVLKYADGFVPPYRAGRFGWSFTRGFTPGYCIAGFQPD